MADHYKILGLTTTATKHQIKEAFRKLAVQFHPDKHAQSPKSTRDAATVKFKQISEAYEVLIDDRKRAAYNLGRRYNNGGDFYSSARSSGGGYSYNNANYGSGYYYGGSYTKGSSSWNSNSGRWASSLENFFRFLRSRTFLLNLAFSGILLGCSVVFDKSRERLWKLQNSGKSFEEAMEIIEKNKTRKGK